MIKLLLDDQNENDNDRASADALSGDPSRGFSATETASESKADGTPVPSLFAAANTPKESIAETARKSGLAWSAGIVMFGSIGFMLLIGWGADLLFGSSPWGIVVGIVIGAAIGFFQLFRLTSQIFRK